MSNNLIQVPHELFVVTESSHFEGTFTQENMESGPDTFVFRSPVAWSVDLTNTGDALLMTGTANAQVTTECARCLDEVAYNLTGEIEGYFLLSAEGAQPEDRDDDEFDVLPESKIIDVVPYALAALLVETPLVPLCDEECKGLCQHCGSNLNEGPCDCEPREEEDEKPNPFAVLKDITFDEN